MLRLIYEVVHHPTMKSEPILLEQVDLKIWNRLDEVDSLFFSGKGDRARSMLLSIVEDVSITLNPVHSAVLVRILRTAVREDLDDLQSVALKVMEKCSLTDTYPALEAVDILLSKGNLEFAGYIIERQNAVSDLAFLEYERGRMAIAQGKIADAKEHFLRSYGINPLFMRTYDQLMQLNPGSYEWCFRKNIALLMRSEPAEGSGSSFPNSNMEALYRIYWEAYRGDRTAARNMLDVSVSGDNSPEFRLAAARIYKLMGDPETSVRFYRLAYEEMPESVFVKTEFAHSLISSGRPEESLLILDEVERTDPLNRGMMEGKMKALSALGKKADVKQYASSFMNSEHADRDGYIFTAKALSESGDTSEASKIIETLIARVPNDPCMFILRSSNELAAGRFTSALASADEAVRIAPKDPGSRFQRAKILVEIGRTKKAMRDIDAALSASRTYIPALVLLKDIHMGQKDYENALRLCDDILLIQSSDSDVIKDKAYALDILGRKEESLNEYRNALRVRHNEQLFEDVLTLLVGTKRYDELYGLFNEFSQEYEKNAMMWRLKGNAEYASGDHLSAMDSYAKASELSPYEPQIWHSRGMAAEMAGQLKKAEEAFDKALLMDLDNSDFWLSKAVIQEKRGNLKGAVLALNRVISESPESMFALVRKALILVKLGRYDEALFFIDLALKINTKDVAVHEFKKEVLKHNSMAEQVIRASEDMLLVDPRNYGALKDKAAAQLSLGYFQMSLLTADQALAEYPDTLEFLMIKKNALRGMDDPEGIEKVCRQILIKDPHNRDIRMDLADALAEKGETESAIRIYDQLLEEDPLDMRVTVMKAKVRSNIGDDSEAVALFQEIMENKPSDPDTLNVLADVMIEQGLGEEAVRVLERAIKADPGDIRSYRSKARVLISDGNYDQAQDTLREALRKDPGDPQIWKLMGQVQETRGDLRQALLSYDSAMKMGIDSPDMYASRGRVQEALGMDEAAINSYSLAAVKNPKDLNSLIHVSVIQMKLGRLSAAGQNLDSVLSADPKNEGALYNRARLHMLNGNEEGAQKIYADYRNMGYNSEISRKFRELVGGDVMFSEKDDERTFNNDVERYSHEVLEFCYNTGYAIRDKETFQETKVPDETVPKILEYLGGIEEYGDLNIGSREFGRMERLSRNLVLNERITNIDSEPLVNLSSAYMASGAGSIDEAKRVVAYIYKVMTEDIEQDIYPEEVVQVAKELSSAAGDVTTFGVIESFDVGVCCARMSKMLSGKMSDSITFHI